LSTANFILVNGSRSKEIRFWLRLGQKRVLAG
jgi:hypothetical protein